MHPGEGNIIFNEGDLYTETFVVSNETYLNFLHLSKDYNPLHTDEQFAINNGFKGKVMHGNILNVFLSYFIGECLPSKKIIIHSQEIQFKNAVYLNEILKFDAQILGVHKGVNAIEFKFSFKNSLPQTVAKGKIQIGLLK